MHQLLRLAATAALQELPGRVADFWQARRVVVQAPDDQPYQVDGDLGGHGGFTYEVSDARFKILIP
jgi:diacylglycerol kinase family enzyme